MGEIFVKFQDLALLLVINCIIIFILHTFQKRAINETLKKLRKEIGDLENLVAAIIEEFEEIADSVLIKESGKGDKYFNGSVESINSDKSINNSLESNNGEISSNNSTETKNDRLDSTEFGQIDTVLQVDNIPDAGEHLEKPKQKIDFFNIKDPKHKQILELWSQGLTIEEISRKLEKGRGEIQLVLGLYKRS